LIADPDEELQPVYREPLAQAGFDVITPGSGLDYVARLLQSPSELAVGFTISTSRLLTEVP